MNEKEKGEFPFYRAYTGMYAIFKKEDVHGNL
jgi:hypothetical protein